jgi:oligo-1,6-glucosidase
VFQFEHVSQGWDPKIGKWKPKPFDLVALKRVMNKWQAACAEDGWNALFWGNHDLPRAVSKYGDDGKYRVESAKCLATVLHLMKGTPYIYQGEEFGMTNAAFTRIEQFKDVETLNFYALQTAAGVDPAAFIAGANANGRDNARTPMQWTGGAQAGFSSGVPWIGVTANYATLNAARDRADPAGIFAHYRTLIALRKAQNVVRHGLYVPFLEDHPQVFAYLRQDGGQRLAVIANVSGGAVTVAVPEALQLQGRSVSANYVPRDAVGGVMTLAPWEAVAVLAGA